MWEVWQLLTDSRHFIGSAEEVSCGRLNDGDKRLNEAVEVQTRDVKELPLEVYVIYPAL